MSTIPTEPSAGWDASQIKQPGWNHVEAAFIEGAREAKANPECTDADVKRAADGYTKRVFEEVDPVSEKALRTESWAPAVEAPRAREALEAALKQTWQMVDVLRPPGAPGSYARGEHNGICSALTTLRENFERIAARAALSGKKDTPT